MEFSTAFWNALPTRPLEALGALYWHVTGRKMRARNRLRINPEQAPQAYQHWIDRVECRDEALSSAHALMDQWKYRPLFSILALEPNHGDAAGRLAKMMREQVYPHWELLIPTSKTRSPTDNLPDGFRLLPDGPANEFEMLRSGAHAARGRYLLPLPPEVQLPPTALFRYCEQLQTYPDAAMLFGDQDRIDSGGQRDEPWFKPQWNDELALAQDYVSQALVIPTEQARSCLQNDSIGLSAPVYAMALAVARLDEQHIVHVPHVQSHVREPKSDEAERIVAVRGHLLDRGERGASVSSGRYGIIRVDWPLPEPPPSVTIIIPTRDRIELLRACLSSLMDKTGYPNFDILVIDNGSSQVATLAYLDDLTKRGAIQVVRDELPYNFPRMNNMAVHHAGGDYVCLLNNDTEIIDGDWLDAMMRQAVRPHVGAVGARLLYDDRSIQHAGVTIGLGDAAGHPHRFQNSEEFGYFGRTHAAHQVSAVTAACLVVNKDKFLAVGGMDEQAFGVAFNDVDFCLKLTAAGWTNVYTPYATLLHHESKSRGRDSSPEHVQRYRRELATLRSRWNTIGYLDPLHHVHLDHSVERLLIKI